MKTTAAILECINEPLKLMEVEIPELGNGQVLIRIAYSGLCHAQINEMRGLKGEDKFLPHAMGHEASAVVESIGPGVEKVKPGDRVVATWIQGSGINAPSTKYKDDAGNIINAGAITTFMEYAVISENRLVKIPDNMPLKPAALLGCAVPTGAGMVFNSHIDFAVNSIAVFGAGGIGLSATMAASAKNVACIIVVDVVQQKLDQAQRVGATHLVNASNSDAVDEIMRITGDKGVDCAVESAGIKQAMESAFRATRCNGGLCVLAGNLPSGETISIDPMDLIKGKRLVGSWGGGTDPDRDIPMYANQYLSGALKLDELITHEYPLSEINSACDDLEQRRVGRAIIEFGWA